MCGPCTLTRRELEAANGSVKRILVEATNVVGNGMSPRHSQYNEYTAEVRAQIKKYVAENGTSKAGRHFSERLGCKVAESSARSCKPEYLQRIKQMASHRGCGESPLVEKSQLTKPRGRLLLLGDALDKAVQDKG